MRFKSHGLAPKSAADFAFLLHGFHFLKDEGVMAIILPQDTHRDLVEIEKSVKAATIKHNQFLKELGLPALPL